MIEIHHLFEKVTLFAQNRWISHLKNDDVIIDATCGNGRDTLFLAKKTSCKIFALDIQQEAILSTENRLKREISIERFKDILLFQQCHSTFPSESELISIGLVVYNLGYLPGGKKYVTTKVNTTLQSIEKALSIIRTDGLISITCYPGHDEGLLEEKAILQYLSQLDSKSWKISYFVSPEKKSPPSLLLIQRRDYGRGMLSYI